MLTGATLFLGQYALESHPIVPVQWTCGVFTICHIERMWVHGYRERNSLMFPERR